MREVVFCAFQNKSGDCFFTLVCYIVPENIYNAEAVKSAVEKFCIMKFPEDSRQKCIFIKEYLPLNKGNKPGTLVLECKWNSSLGII